MHLFRGEITSVPCHVIGGKKSCLPTWMVARTKPEVKQNICNHISKVGGKTGFQTHTHIQGSRHKAGQQIGYEIMALVQLWAMGVIEGVIKIA